MEEPKAKSRKKQQPAPLARQSRPFLRMTALIEEDGTPVEGLVLIKLQHRGYGIIEEAAHDKVAAHVNRDPVSYYAKGNIVNISPPQGATGGNAIGVAKLLVELRDSREWPFIHYLDGNSFNLRDGNIYGSLKRQRLNRRFHGGIDPDAPISLAIS